MLEEERKTQMKDIWSLLGKLKLWVELIIIIINPSIFHIIFQDIPGPQEVNLGFSWYEAGEGGIHVPTLGVWNSALWSTTLNPLTYSLTSELSAGRVNFKMDSTNAKFEKPLIQQPRSLSSRYRFKKLPLIWTWSKMLGHGVPSSFPSPPEVQVDLGFSESFLWCKPGACLWWTSFSTRPSETHGIYVFFKKVNHEI